MSETLINALEELRASRRDMRTEAAFEIAALIADPTDLSTPLAAAALAELNPDADARACWLVVADVLDQAVNRLSAHAETARKLADTAEEA